jgi:hypothetical protein
VSTSIDIRRDAEELARFYSELARRLPQHGIRDVTELLTLFEQLRRAVDTISRQEIGWVAEQTERLIDALVRMDATLQALRRLKAALDHLPSDDLRPRTTS